MKVNKQKYYHIHTYQTQPTITLGQKKNWNSETPNKFWEFYLLHSIRYQDDPYKGKFAAMLADTHLKSREANNSNLNINVLKFLANATSEMGMLNRELVFEEYRREHFPKLPSRRNCIWLCNNQENLKFWYNWYKHNPYNKIVYELSCTGVIHIGSGSFLNSDSMNYTEYIENAQKYWEGVETAEKNNNETIFEGEIEVIAQVKPSFFM